MCPVTDGQQPRAHTQVENTKVPSINKTLVDLPLSHLRCRYPPSVPGSFGSAVLAGMAGSATVSGNTPGGS